MGIIKGWSLFLEPLAFEPGEDLLVELEVVEAPRAAEDLADLTVVVTPKGANVLAPGGGVNGDEAIVVAIVFLEDPVRNPKEWERVLHDLLRNRACGAEVSDARCVCNLRSEAL